MLILCVTRLKCVDREYEMSINPMTIQILEERVTKLEKDILKFKPHSMLNIVLLEN